jgi:hypothetical protein
MTVLTIILTRKMSDESYVCPYSFPRKATAQCVVARRLWEGGEGEGEEE